MTTTRVYLAGRSEDRLAVRTLRDRLAPHDIRVTARWVDGLVESQQLGALHCLLDIAAADVFVLLNLPRIHRTGTGGRHVETGIALATGKPVIVFGERENVFHHLRPVTCVPSTTPIIELVAIIRGLVRDSGGDPSPHLEALTREVGR